MKHKDEIAIEVQNISKTFRIPHEKISSLRGAAVNMFKRKSYEEFQALDDISFEVKRGEFFGIIGRNGSGKSTLLKILAGIYQPDAPVKCAKGDPAKREFHGIKINGLISPFLELGIGFNPELSGRDNVYLNATVLGLTKKQIDKKFDDIVAFSELERFIDQKLKNYSSGMQVRLAFSVAIHANRDILLMDEVLAVGDSNFQSKCLTEFNRYKELGKTVILVTHDITTIQRYCDRAMLLRNGKIMKIGKADEVGNVYIYQNMSDEEKRIADEDKRKDDDINEDINKEKKEKFAGILNVILIDENKQEKNVFLSGKKINIVIKIEVYKKIRNPEFGIIISNTENIQIFNTNTVLKKIKTGEFDVGLYEIDFEIKNLLTSGVFKLTAAISSEDAKNFYDWKNDIRTFEVFSERPMLGLVDLEHNIIINK